MTDYSSWKVADLKIELKNRGIPQTGLRLKQQFIDKLNEEDGGAQPEEASVPPAAEAQPESEPEANANDSAQPIDAQVPEVQEQQPTAPAPEPKHDAPAPTKNQPSPAPQSEEKDTPPPTTDTAQPEPTETMTQDHQQDGGKDQIATEDTEKASTAAPEQEPEDTAVMRAESAKPAEISGIQTSEANTELSTPIPVEEALEDKLKRKRRSQSPIPSAEAIANKKLRAEEEQPLMQVKDEVKDEDDKPQPPKDEPSMPAKDARFRELITPAVPAPSREITMHDADVEPAVHPATAALYIDGLMRPLQPVALQTHLVSLAAPVDDKPNPEVVQEFFLDAIKTHCFVKFSDVAAASRVRANLHGTTWPNERNRKALRVDFIPDEKVTEWIRTEEESRGRAGPPVRWEIQYEREGDEGITAVLAEVNANRLGPSRPREPGFNRTPPLGPRGGPSQSDAESKPPSHPGQGFKPLDELFESTATKPKLYYKRVPREVADKRLDQFDDLLKKGPVPRRGGEEMRRITFEEDDYFVDIGPEYGSGSRAPHRSGRGGRGGRGGRPGGNRRGSGY